MTAPRIAAFFVGLVLALAVPATAASAQPVAPAQLGASDLALLNGVRQAGLWEMPAGQMAADRGSAQRVREVGAEIAAQHAKLDELVVDAANKLGIQLPTQPTADQQKWLNEMRGAATAREFDRIFVERLRAAHGKIFPVIGAVRSGTRNEIIRKLAQDSNGFVLTHMSLLESTGLVRYGDLPPAALPPDQPKVDSLQETALAKAAAGSGFSAMVIWVVVLVAGVLGIGGTWRLFKPR